MRFCERAIQLPLNKSLLDYLDGRTAENNNVLMRARCFPQPRLTPSVDGSGTDFLLEITGEGVDKITESTPHLWTSTAAGAATAHVWKLHFLFARRLCCPRRSIAAVEDLLRDVTIFQVTLEDACWERIFTEYLTSGLFDSTYSTSYIHNLPAKTQNSYSNPP